MPNTLMHVGVQGLLTRAILRNADFKWICVGCVIPDMAWILQRLVLQFLGDSLLSLYQLRLYVIVQSSLMYCFLLCLVGAILSATPRRVFGILAFNSALHLILDACETKWGNGVHFFAPFSWRLVNFGFFWPDSLIVVITTVWSLGFFWYCWRHQPGQELRLDLRSRLRLLVACTVLALYFFTPSLFKDGPEAADNHSIRVLRRMGQRAGQPVEFDRRPYFRRGNLRLLRTFTGEELILCNLPGIQRGVISLRGQFIDRQTVEAQQVHRHWPWFRDAASILGLLLVTVVWLDWLGRCFARKDPP